MRSGLKSAAAALLLTILAALPTAAQNAKGRSSAPPPPPTGGSGKYFRLDYPGSTEPNQLQTAVSYLLWIPDGVTQLRGLIVHQHGAGTTASIEGSTAAYDLHWQALAKKWDCALLEFLVPRAEREDRSDARRLGALVRSAPGLGEDVPQGPRRVRRQVGPRRTGEGALGPLGTLGRRHLVRRDDHASSRSASWRSGCGPDRRSCSAPEPSSRSPRSPTAAYAVPAMCNPGVKEKRARTPARWPRSRNTGRRGAPIGFAPDPRTGHECGDSRYLAIPFFDACLAMRLPDKGSKDQTLKPVDMSKGWLASSSRRTPRMPRPCRRRNTRATPTKRSGCPTRPWPRRGWSTSRRAPWATPRRRPLRST